MVIASYVKGRGIKTHQVHLHFNYFTETARHYHMIPPLAHRQQRRAHNSEVTGSTHVGGIHFYRLQYF